MRGKKKKEKLSSQISSLQKQVKIFQKSPQKPQKPIRISVKTKSSSTQSASKENLMKWKKETKQNKLWGWILISISLLMFIWAFLKILINL